MALEALGRVSKLNAVGTAIANVDVGPRPRHLAIDAAGSRLLVSRFITRPLPGEGTGTISTVVDGVQRGAEVVALDLSSPTAPTISATVTLRHSDRPDSTVQGRGVPNYLGAPAISPDGTAAWVPSKQDNVKRGKLRDGLDLDFQSTVRAITSRIALGTLTEDHPARIDHDDSGVASAAAFHPSGAYLFVALETSRQIAVVDPVSRGEIARFDAGRAPQALSVAPDGVRLYVSNFMDRTVTVFDLVPIVNYGETRLPVLSTLTTVSAERLSTQVLRGKQLFYDARDARLARDGYVSCASCHRDAESDGRTWDFTGFGEGLRNTIGLRGRASAHGPLHWSGNFDEVQDFEGQIRAFGGTGLMTDDQLRTGSRAAPLGDRKAGVSPDLDALAAYVTSLATFDLSPARAADGTLTGDAVAGRAVFIARCAECHGGAGFTSSVLGGLQNVGTVKPSSGQRLGAALAGIDVPSLRDVWATAPYLHDGSAPTLADAIRAHGAPTLTAAEVAQVSAFVQQIGREEPDLARAVRATHIKFEQLSEVNGAAWGSMAEFNLLDAGGAPLTRTGWTAQADSAEVSGEDGRASNALDGNPDTIWHTQWSAGNSPPPHHFIVNLNASVVVGGLRYLPRQSGPVNGTIARFRVYTSTNGSTWGSPVTEGDFNAMGPVRTEKTVRFE